MTGPPYICDVVLSDATPVTGAEGLNRRMRV